MCVCVCVCVMTMQTAAYQNWPFSGKRIHFFENSEIEHNEMYMQILAYELLWIKSSKKCVLKSCLGFILQYNMEL